MQSFVTGPNPFRALVEAAPDAILALDGHGSILFANPAAERLFGYPREELLGRPMALLGVESLPEGIPETGHELSACTRTGKELRLECTLAELPGAGEAPCRTLFLRDVTLRSQVERRLRLEHAVARVLAESATWEDAVPLLLRSLCQEMGWEAGILWQAEPDAPVLCYGGAWRAPGSPADPLLALSRRMAFLPGVGLPGRVWEERAPVWVPEMCDPAFPRARAAAESGLRRAFAFPILLGGETFGVLELLDRAAAEPDAEWREALSAMGSAIGQFVLRKRSEAAVAEREKHFRSLIEYASDVITVLDARGIVRYESPAVERVLGYAPEELLGTDPFCLIHPDDAPRTRKALALAVRTPGVAIALEYRFRHRDGTWKTLESVGRNLLHDPVVAGVVVNSRDVTTRRRMEDEVRRLSLTDELTGLRNRRGFFAVAEQQLRLAQRTGGDLLLLFADLDGLKEINDRQGHAEGDHALASAAAVLRQTFRQSDVLARVGGDEFVVLAEVSRERGELLVERLHQRIREWNEADGEHPPLSMSLGVAWYEPERLCTVEALLQEADTAMYARKRRR